MIHSDHPRNRTIVTVTVPSGLLTEQAPPLPLTRPNVYFTSCTMSASIATATTTQAKPKSPRGGGAGNRGRRGSGPARRKPQNDSAPTESTDTADTPATPTTTTPAVTKPDIVVENTDTTSQDDDSGTCLICAEPVKYYSVSECNHQTCHVCALRLRALYKKQECSLCKVRSSFSHKNKSEFTINSFSVGTPIFLDLHDKPQGEVHIVRTG